MEYQIQLVFVKHYTAIIYDLMLCKSDSTSLV
jgi:hypothetical protein